MSSNQISEKDYKSYVKEIETLIDLDPAEGTKEAARLKLLALAVQVYEKERFSFERPTPIEAIKFRMEEMGLKQADLIPYFGGKNRASEVLAGKRPLTLPMIKALNRYLGIPLDVLVNEGEVSKVTFHPEQISFDQELVGEIVKKGWLKKQEGKKAPDFRNMVDAFLKPIGGLSPANLLCKQSAHLNVRNKTGHAALFLWSAKVLIEAKKYEVAPYAQESVTPELLKEIAHLSVFDEGPLLAREMLGKNGIKLVIVPHLASTFLDGGVLIDEEGRPVIGLTLRYDRLDNFWHTLLHELAHIYKHLKIVAGPFLDDSDNEVENDPIEKEADQISREAAIPRASWTSSGILQTRTKDAVLSFAKELRIHPSIVAGRVRFETKNYKLFPELLGSGSVRKMFGVGS